MNATQERAKSIFLNAIDIAAPGERQAFVESQCAGNDLLRAEVDELLQHERSLGSFLESPPAGLDTTAIHPNVESPGTAIGPYKLLEQIGEGGFGVVFLAEQERPVRRRVALKIIKPGMDTREVIARFGAERQALALMDHPNIAKVHDAGTTENGRPYFVMELVQGIPITEYCDQCNLTMRERLRLFVTVCQAVQHAHQKGVIHRDLKPTNILVAIHDSGPSPKIIDFGVAKALNERLTEQTLATGFAQMLGTPLYMSPEQAELSPLGVDTRSDIYSLGVLLYEMLTGTTPFDKERLHQASYDELRQILREENPPRPSARLSSLSRSGEPSRTSSNSLPLAGRAGEGVTAGVTQNANLATTIAERRRTDPRRLIQTIRGDLDWIVMKCLDKDRNRRYETASALAEDLLHHLGDEPVTAGPPSRLYRLAKFAKRNRASVLAGTAVMAGLLACVIGMWMALVSQSRQRAAAERQRAEALLNLATALHSQGRYAKAEEFFRTGLESVGDASAEDEQRAAHARLHLARVVYELGDRVESEQLYREALSAFRASFPPGDPAIAHAQTSLALILRAHQRFEEAETLLREAFDINRRATPADHRAIGNSATHLANVLITLRKYAEAETIARQAVAEQQAAVPIDFVALAFARVELGRDLIALGKYSEAEAEILEAERILSFETEFFHVGILAPIALYSTWDQAEPGKGYDAKAQQWTRKLIGTYIRLEELWPELSSARQQAPQSHTTQPPDNREAK